MTTSAETRAWLSNNNCLDLMAILLPVIVAASRESARIVVDWSGVTIARATGTRIAYRHH